MFAELAEELLAGALEAAAPCCALVSVELEDEGVEAAAPEAVGAAVPCAAFGSAVVAFDEELAALPWSAEDAGCAYEGWDVLLAPVLPLTAPVWLLWLLMSEEEDVAAPVAPAVPFVFPAGLLWSP